MMPPVIALTGLSGVGKSTLLRRLSIVVPMQILQASALIKETRTAMDSNPVTLDDLRGKDLNENQRLLVQGFNNRLDRSASLVILDCHTVIETPNGLVRVDPQVFGLMNVAAIVFLEDTPSEIVSRRQRDSSRERPATTAADLFHVQMEALRHTEAIAAALNLPLYVHRATGEDLMIADKFYSFRKNA